MFEHDRLHFWFLRVYWTWLFECACIIESMKICISNHVLAEVIGVSDIECYFRTDESVICVLCEFQIHFNFALWKLVPNCSKIINWIKFFCETVNTSNKKLLSNLRNAHTLQNIKQMSNSERICPGCSAEKHEQSSGFSHEFTRQILHHDLHYHLFNPTITQSLKQTDYHSQKSFTETIFDEIFHKFNRKNLMMNDEWWSAISCNRCSR